MKLDFRTKLFMTISISLILVSNKFHLKYFYLTFFIGLVPFMLFNIKYRTKKYIIYTLIYVCSFFINSFLNGKLYSVNLIPIMLLLAFSNLFSGIMMGYYTLKTTKMVDLVRSLELMKMPYFIIIPFSVMHRFFYSIKNDYSNILKAMKLKGLTFRNLWKSPIKMLEYRVVPLAMIAMKSADDLTISAMSRGLIASSKRSSISNARLKWYDYLIIIIMSLLLILRWCL